MPVLCDMKVIQGDAQKLIGDGGTANWEPKFNTGGRRASGDAILMLMVKGLTNARSDVPVKINGTQVGVIELATGNNANQWFTQIISIGGANLKDGDNELEISAAPASQPGPGNLYDDFILKNVVCFFQQSS